MLERVPEEHFNWKPHEKSMSLGALSAHLVNLVYWSTVTLEQDELDLASPTTRTSNRRGPAVFPESLASLLDLFDRNREELRQAIKALEESALERPWALKRGTYEILKRPKGALFRTMCISHMVHHRGQLSVYLRLLDVPVPPSYGPTADEGM
jgi:uncharacterized damage-inducible protein DinB